MNSEVKGIIFAITSVLTGGSMFLPAFKTEYVTGTKEYVEYTKLMPSILSCIVLIACGACAFMVFAGLKNYCAWAAAVQVILGGIDCYLVYNSAHNNILGSENMGALLDLFGAKAPEITVTVEWGFYIFIILMAVNFIMSVIYVMSRD